MWPFTRKRGKPSDSFDWSAYDDLPRPKPEIDWRGQWRAVDDREEQLGIQRELDVELSSAHPLWESKPVVFGRCTANDDVLVALSDGRFAIVHLVWHGHVDAMPGDFPSVEFVGDLDELKEFLARSNREWEDENDEQ